MDDAPDRGYSRAPELEDLLSLVRALDRAGARYLLIGGFAVILQGFVRTTKDIDLLVDPSPSNVRALKEALATLPDNAVAAMGDDELTQYPVVRVADEVVVDLMAVACGITYEQAVREREDLVVEGVTISRPPGTVPWEGAAADHTAMRRLQPMGGRIPRGAAV